MSKKELIQSVNKAIDELDFEFPYNAEDWIKNGMVMENYHKHTTWSNLVQIDSATSIEDFIDLLKKYGCKCYFSGEHGYPGEWLNVYSICQKTDMKFVYSSEVYWVKNRTAIITEEYTDKDGNVKTREHKDNTNCHMILIARNYQAIRKLNYIITKAHEDGFYYKPRIDLDLLFTLTPEDVYITSACIAGWKYEDATEIWYKIWKHFGDSFFLEYQPHPVKEQIELNKRIYEFSKSTGIKTIIGLDTHYISEEDKIKRSNLLKRKNLNYPEEEGWLLDFPSGEEVFSRMKKQKVLPEEEIIRAMMNTHTFVSKCEDIELNNDFKIPIIDELKDSSYENRCDELYKIILDKYKSEPQSDERLEGLNYEFNEIVGSGTADYFISNYYLIDKAINKYGGKLTTTSRGSASSYYCSKLLGFTTMDRFDAEVPIYPERFITKDRVLSSHQMPDIDLNIAVQDPFVSAARELFGEHGCYPLLAVGKLGEKSGFKAYADVAGIEPSVANDITSLIDAYNEDLKNLEEGDSLDIEDYIKDSKHLKIFNESKPYQGIIEQARIHACFVKGQIVLTSTGYKEIQDVQIGDSVLSHDNEYHKVIDTLEKESNNIYKIKTTGDPLLLTGDHLVYVVTNTNAGKPYRRFSEPYWKKASELTKNDFICSPINNKSVIPVFEETNKFYKNQKINLEDPNFWWIIGRYFGDGWTEHPINKKGFKCNRVIICCNKNGNALKDISSKIPEYLHFNILEYRTSYKFVTENKILFDFLQQFGKYAYGKRLTNTILDLPINLLKEFLDGYFSADGYSLYSKYVTNGFSTVSRELAYGIQQCIQKVYKVPCSISTTKPGKDIIEGRVCNRRKKYRGSFGADYGLNIRKKNIYMYGSIWYKVSNIEKLNSEVEKVYDLTVEDSHSYTVNNLAVHNCGHCLFNGDNKHKDWIGYGDIRYEFGLIRCHSESTGRSTLVANAEGSLLDAYGYVKDDFLIVDVVSIINKLYSSIGMKVPNVTELRKMVTGDNAVWNLYAKGATCCLNQCEKIGTTQKVKVYKPKSIKELAAFIAGIRPGFKSLVNGFLNRITYSNGEKAIDDLLEDCFHYMLYQEAVMKIFTYLGIPMKDSYDTIKKISKKKLKGEALKHVEDTLREHWLANIGNLDNFESVYKVIKDSARYSFNAPHALAMANDSLYEAWVKAHYTSKFYEVTMNHYQDKGDKNKVLELQQEATKMFGYKFGSFEFGRDNRKISVNDEQKTIYPNLATIKHISSETAEVLYQLGLKEYANFFEVLKSFEGRPVNSRQIDILIKLDYFKKFGDINFLLDCIKKYDFLFGKKNISKESIKSNDIPEELFVKYALSETEKMYKVNEESINNIFSAYYKKTIIPICSLSDRLKWQEEFLGYIDYVDPNISNKIIFVTKLDTKYSPKFNAYSVKTGKYCELRVHKKKDPKKDKDVTTFNQIPFEDGDVLIMEKCEKKPKVHKVGDKWEELEGQFNWWLVNYKKVT